MGVSVLPQYRRLSKRSGSCNYCANGARVFDTGGSSSELIGDDDTLQPDVFQLVEAAEILIKDGFKVPLIAPKT